MSNFWGLCHCPRSSSSSLACALPSTVPLFALSSLQLSSSSIPLLLSLLLHRIASTRCGVNMVSPCRRGVRFLQWVLFKRRRQLGSVSGDIYGETSHNDKHRGSCFVTHIIALPFHGSNLVFFPTSNSFIESFVKGKGKGRSLSQKELAHIPLERGGASAAVSSFLSGLQCC